MDAESGDGAPSYKSGRTLLRSATFGAGSRFRVKKWTRVAHVGQKQSIEEQNQISPGTSRWIVDRPGNDVKAIFIAALDYEAGADRIAHLDAACGDNAELRRRVEALLAAHDRADEVAGNVGEPLPESGAIDSNAGRLEELEEVVSSWQASSTADYEQSARPDALIAGRYTLQQKLGEGGMGEVWVAKQVEPVKRKVALKLIKTGMDSRAVLARFEQERRPWR